MREAIRNELEIRFQDVQSKIEGVRNAQIPNQLIPKVQELGRSISFYIHFVMSTPLLNGRFTGLLDYFRNLNTDSEIQSKLAETAALLNGVGNFFKQLPDYEDACATITSRTEWLDPFSNDIRPYATTKALIEKMATLTDLNSWNYKKMNSLLSIIAGDYQRLNGIIPYWPEFEKHDISSLLVMLTKLREIANYFEFKEDYDYKFSGAKAASTLHKLYLLYNPNPIGKEDFDDDYTLISYLIMKHFESGRKEELSELAADVQQVHSKLIAELSKNMNGDDVGITKILFLSSNCDADAFLKLDEEVREIEEGLRRSYKRDKFSFVKKLAVRPVDFNRALLEEKPDILHFSGHGCTAGIMLQNNNGEPHLVSTTALAGIFSLFTDTVKCVLLNSCYSEAQVEEISKHIPYVIGNNTEVNDQSAITFAVSFYDALAAGKDIEFAFKYAKAALSIEGLPGNDVPVLYKSGVKLY
ncbi:MAG: hypothetical protein H6Q69_2116 [Firmicutes bacterium]|nr:hypothetical protein [Bacillota bacterium]